MFQVILLYYMSNHVDYRYVDQIRVTVKQLKLVHMKT